MKKTIKAIIDFLDMDVMGGTDCGADMDEYCEGCKHNWQCSLSVRRVEKLNKIKKLYKEEEK